MYLSEILLFMTNNMINLAIFASGSGTNAENLIQFFSGSNRYQIKLIVSNKPDAYVLKRAEKFGIESHCLSSEQIKDHSLMIEVLKQHQIDFVVLAGYLKLIPPVLIEQFPSKIVNIHPALLPKFGGKGMYGMNVHRAVVDAKEAETGISIHYVNEHYDSGNIIFQVSCSVLPNDTADDVAQKIHELEMAHFPVVLEQVLRKTWPEV